jgi:hypothetical protein
MRIKYLGLIISENRVEMDPVKVAGVAEWPELTSKQEVQSFLGFVNFYRRFVKDFSHHAWPLFNLTCKEQKWKWDSPEASAFRKLKELVTSAPVLITPADDQSFRIEADSSDFATGAVLSQLSAEDGKWHPVAFLSKSLSETERKYEIHDKEMLAIMRVLDKWWHFLEGASHKVEIWTDHKKEPLPTPETRWHTVSVDFIVELPESDGYDVVMVVVDSLTKRSHFLPVNTTITAVGSARQFWDNVWKHHGLPTCVISDRGPQFTAEFTTEVYQLLGIEAAKTTAYHPQADGQMERVNQELEQYLRLFCGERQNDWADLLPMAEFQYNILPPNRRLSCSIADSIQGWASSRSNPHVWNRPTSLRTGWSLQRKRRKQL